MKIDFSTLKITDISGKEIEEDIFKVVGNKVWEFASDISLRDIAVSIYNGVEVDISTQQAEQIKQIMNDSRNKLLPFVGREISIFIDKH